jgi:hypothetical protein
MQKSVLFKRFEYRGITEELGYVDQKVLRERPHLNPPRAGS